LSKIKIAAVSYLNTKPLLWGLKKSKLYQNIELTEDYPTNIAHQLLNNIIDIALVPVAIIPQLREYYLISQYCIGAVNEVASVSIFSRVELSKIKKIILDYQSKTSVALTQVLCKYFWKIDVEFVQGEEGYINQINDTTAAVVIGDRALTIKGNFEYDYDLAKAWQDFTKLPFVFATWIANKPINKEVIVQLDEAMQIGLNNLQQVANENNIAEYDLLNYYTHNISYQFDDKKKQGLDLFLSYLKEG
jgi:chorismate dehydratase